MNCKGSLSTELPGRSVGIRSLVADLPDPLPGMRFLTTDAVKYEIPGDRVVRHRIDKARDGSHHVPKVGSDLFGRRFISCHS